MKGNPSPAKSTRQNISCVFMVGLFRIDLVLSLTSQQRGKKNIIPQFTEMVIFFPAIESTNLAAVLFFHHSQAYSHASSLVESY